MLPDAEVGDYVLVHVGVAISKIDEEEAKKTFEYLQEIGELDELVESSQIERDGGSCAL
jgi:hydrogenase expression/formation protein HypC